MSLDMFRLIICLFTSCLISSFSFADSSGVGNGGDALICPDKTILLDTYEANKMRLHLDLGPGQTWRELVNVAIVRVMKFDQGTGSLLYNYAMEIVNDLELYKINPEARGKSLYIGNDIIAEINDSEHVSIPAGCEIRQLVNQKVPKFKFEYRYEMNKEIWDKMSIREQSMTVLHEAWYRIMLENGALNSRSARYMNGLTSSAEFEGYSFGQYITELKNTEIKNYQISNVSDAIVNKQIIINLKEHVLEIFPEYACAPKMKVDLSIKKRLHVFDTENRYIKNIIAENFCFKNSKPLRIQIKKSLLDIGVSLRLEHYFAYLDSDSGNNPTLNFHSNGKLKSLSDINIDTLFRMYYVCSGKRVFGKSKRDGCEEGGYIHRDSGITTPRNVEFDSNEVPIGFKFPDKP
jgi:hypothetical protein